MAVGQLPKSLGNCPSTDHLVTARATSDHIPIATTIELDLITPEIRKFLIKHGSEEESAFLTSVIGSFSKLAQDPSTPEEVDAVAQAIADTFGSAWDANTTEACIVTELKPWWDWGCKDNFDRYQMSQDPTDWATFAAL
ncbi:hypothetical protein HYPSUDRAFT_206411 [Hypholoma sublateritium FD-334 SS-4]|uniref:Endonuclease/exonuclease/phosphatase domain-containing protein n=1 Tax=Hypholoma sublateritium (strain FD-334 SS-4) TaxID=945553 RepID=A0A0D2P9W0_HYPSF|nr:hypothetical protein HYPSUDRAFT_206411 [Hypholoma sublateritium FD-334 SS-4]